LQTRSAEREERAGNVVTLEGDERTDAKARIGLGLLLGARLLLAGLSLGLAFTLDRIGATAGGPGIWGVYWTVAAAFFATIVSGLMVARTRKPQRFATAQVAIDITIVTSLVYFSGGGESVFTFLYALVVLYGALFLDRNGVVFSAGLAAAAYGFVLFGAELGVLPSLGMTGAVRPFPVLIAYWGFYAGALLILGMLANTLSAELHRTGAALDRRTTDLRRLRDLHLRTVESIGSGLLTTDVAGRVTSFNPEAERITGETADDVSGRILEDVIPGTAAHLEEAGATKVFDSTIGRERIAYRNLRSEDLFLGMAASSLRDEFGEQVGHVVIFQDVTGVVSMERELRQSERLAAVGEMAARMAHEIRNPLAAISGSVQVLQGTADEENFDPEQARLMGIVVREVDRLNQLISDFLRYSRPAPIKPEQVRLGSLIEEVAEMHDSRDGTGLEISLDLDSDVVVMADPAQLKAVVWNLWNNAKEAMEDMEAVGRLSVRVGRVSGDVPQDHRSGGRNEQDAGPDVERGTGWTAVLEIEDTGPGIAADVRAMIFEPFFTTKRDGTGLGLATVRRIVEQHDGLIEAFSDGGSGTIFRVSLRCVEADS
jgi:two-component system sensor histidine kinase PilS (NtrC family)